MAPYISMRELIEKKARECKKNTPTIDNAFVGYRELSQEKYGDKGENYVLFKTEQRCWNFLVRRVNGEEFPGIEPTVAPAAADVAPVRNIPSTQQVLQQIEAAFTGIMEQFGFERNPPPAQKMENNNAFVASQQQHAAQSNPNPAGAADKSNKKPAAAAAAAQSKNKPATTAAKVQESIAAGANHMSETSNVSAPVKTFRGPEIGSKLPDNDWAYNPMNGTDHERLPYYRVIHTSEDARSLFFGFQGISLLQVSIHMRVRFEGMQLESGEWCTWVESPATTLDPEDDAAMKRLENAWLLLKMWSIHILKQKQSISSYCRYVFKSMESNGELPTNFGTPNRPLKLPAPKKFKKTYTSKDSS